MPRGEPDFLEEKYTLYVNGLPSNVTYHAVRNKFAQFGAIRRVYLRADNNNAYAFISFFHQASARKALESSGRISFSDHPVRIMRKITSTNAREKNTISEKQTIRLARNLVRHDERNNHLKVPTNPTDIQDSIAHTPAYKVPTREKLLNVSDNQPCLESCPSQSDGNDFTLEHKRILRVDGIPVGWSAEKLYRHLLENGIFVHAVLVYDDFDSRYLCQGLIELGTTMEAVQLAAKGEIRTSQLSLFSKFSSILSIEPVRANYAGNFTAYSILEDTDRYGYSIREPKEPENATMVSSASLNMRNEELLTLKNVMIDPAPLAVSHLNISDAPPNMANSQVPETRECGLFKQTTSNSQISQIKDTPFISGSFSGSRSNTWSLQEESSQISPDSPLSPSKLEDAFVDKNPFGQLDAQNIRTQYYDVTTGAFSKWSDLNQSDKSQAFTPALLPQKVSQTLVVDNLRPDYVQNAWELACSMSPFGEVLVADLVPVCPSRTRAYITFDSALSAELAHRHFVTNSAGVNGLIARLA